MVGNSSLLLKFYFVNCSLYNRRKVVGGTDGGRGVIKFLCSVLYTDDEYRLWAGRGAQVAS